MASKNEIRVLLKDGTIEIVQILWGMLSMDICALLDEKYGYYGWLDCATKNKFGEWDKQFKALEEYKNGR